MRTFFNKETEDFRENSDKFIKNFERFIKSSDKFRKTAQILSIFLLILQIYPAKLFADSEFELAVRNVKLGNTYREAKDYFSAIYYINKGLNVVEKEQNFNGKYWTAASYEYLSYVYRDMNRNEEAKKSLQKASAIYQTIISQKDGSNFATKMLENSALQEEFEREIFAKTFDFPPAGTENFDFSDFNSNNVDFEEIYNTYYPEAETAPAEIEESLAGNVINISNSKKTKNINVPAGTTNFIAQNNKYSEMPPLIFSCKELEYLDLSHNKISEISAMIPTLNKLHYLNLSNNKIKKIPENISDLTNLAELNLENNKLKELPASLAGMTSLKVLNLRGNSISFENIANIIRGLPNTNIIFDKYELVIEEEEQL